MADYLPPVVAELRGDDSNLKTVLARAKGEVRKWAAEVGRMNATVQIHASLDTRAAAADLDLLTRARAMQIRADADTRVAADELALLTRDRTVTVHTRTIGGSPTPTPSPSPGGGGSNSGSSDVKWMSTLVSLAPALVPIAAQLVTIAGAAAAATVAVGAFGVAVIPQIKSLGDAATAHTKYNAAVTKYGAQSKQAVAAQQAYADVLSAMPAATRQAAGGFMVLKDSFKKWSDGLSQFTMAPVTKSFAVVQAILPKLTPMAKGASTQLDRLMTAAGGAVSSPGFDALSKRFSDFANKTLKSATDAVMHFSRLLSEGKANGPISSFMDYAKANGPAVKDTLTNIAKAVGNILQASAQAGPGMLSLVNAMAKLVVALPPEVIARLMQAYTAFKLIKLAGVGIGAASGGVTTLITRITALRAVSIAAGGGVAGLRAAFASLNATAKAGVVLVVLAALAVAAYKLSESTKEARISVDDLARSIEKGLAAGAIKSPVIDDLRKAQQGLVKDTDATASAWDRFAYSFTNWGAKWSSSASSTTAAANDYRDLGNALGTIAQNKGVDTATQALALLNAEGVKIPTKYLTEYNKALADQAFEAKMAANSMGLFGNQAQAVQKKLDAQKASTDGLRQSIQALNDVNRAGLDGEIGFEAAIDAATKAAKDNGKALSVKNGQLQLGSEKARNEATALSDLAAKTDANTAAARDSGKSWATVNAIYTRGRAKLIAAAEAMGLNTTQAKRLADQILKTPDKTAKLKGNIEDLQAKLDSAKRQLKSVPDSRKAKVQANIDKLTAALRTAKAKLNAFNGSSATATIRTNYVTTQTFRPGIDKPKAYGGVIQAFAGGGTVPGYAPMRDSVHAVLSPGEGVLVPEATRMMGGPAGINNINRQARGSGAGAAALSSQAMSGLRHGMSGAPALGHWVGQGLAKGLTGGMASVAAASVGMGKALVAAFSTELGIASPSKKFRSLGAYVINGLVQGLTGSTASVKAATKRIANTLYVDFGSHHKGLQKTVARESKELLSLAVKRDAVAKKLKAAQTKLADLKTKWKDEAKSIADGIMQGFTIVTQAPQEGFALTARDVLNSMTAQMQKAVQFAATLKALKKKGLSAALIEQLAAAGVDQGGDTAAALMGASKSQIDQMNKTQKTTQKAANSTGKVVADAMYGAGIKAAKGLVKGLQSQEKAIEKQMMKIAKAMQKAIKKALGIKSPSQVFRDLGVFIPQGLAQGISDATHHAAAAASDLAGAVTGAGAQGMSGLALAGAGRGGGMVVHNHVHIQVDGHVLTERGLVDIVEKGFLRLGMRNPMTYQPYKR